MTTVTREQKRATVPTLALHTVLFSLLGALVVLGLFAALGRLLLGLGASTALSDGYPWGIWISLDFLLIAFSGAGFTMAALVHVFRQEKYHPALRPALLTGLLGYTAVLLILLLDLGRWDRFYHFMIFWNPHSPLFEICWCVLLYSVVLVIEFSPALFERLEWTRPARRVGRLMLPVAIAGVTLSSLHQSTLGTLYLNMPQRLHALWYTPALPVLFFVSSVMAGLGVAILAYVAAGRLHGQPTRTAVTSGLARGAGWASLLYLLLKLGELGVAGELPRLLALDRPALLFGLELGLGALLPAVLLLLPATRRHRIYQLGGATLILLGVCANRFNATLFAQTSPVAGAIYAPHLMEWLTALGIIAAAALAWYVGARLLLTPERQA
jgi:Ni/Fe-hydrogenase subunit HybB-like protein